MEAPDDSATPSRSTPPDEATPSHNRKRVGFTSNTATPEGPSRSGSPEPVSTVSYPPDAPPAALRSDISHDKLSEEIHRAMGQPYVPKPRPAIRKTPRTPPLFAPEDETEQYDEQSKKKHAGIEAQQRATKLARAVGTYSAPGSRRNSQDLLIPRESRGYQNIPLININSQTAADGAYEEDVPDEIKPNPFYEQADQLLRHHTVRGGRGMVPADFYHSDADALRSGQATPLNVAEMEDEHVPRPPKFRTGVLGTLLKINTADQGAGHDRRRNISSSSTFSTTSTAAGSPRHSPPVSGASTPMASPRPTRPWYTRSSSAGSTTTLSKLVESSGMLATPGQNNAGRDLAEQWKKSPRHKRNKSSSSLVTALGKMTKSNRDEHIKIKFHIAGTLQRQTYLRRLCKALMMYGAPTHRLEEYMNMSARVLEIEAQFLYIPGCMIISFDDSSVHTTEVKLVRCAQGIDLGKLRDVHEIYKDVVHDRIGVEEATARLEGIISRKNKYGNWFRVPMYGLASAMVGPFAFQARLIDLPFCFLLGCILGWLQLIVAPQNELLSNVLEISAAVITSFIARGLGSITHNGKEVFCFSAMAQSSIALILPGFTVLSASLELQSRHLVAGSVRMVYAIIYSLILGFGITIGTVIFGMIYKNATSNTTCKDPISEQYYYIFVLAFSLCLMVVNQAQWKQVPTMLAISIIGYAVNIASSKRFRGNAQVSNTLGAFAIGVAANLNARFGRHVENWSLDFWENNLRPKWRRISKKYNRGTHGRIDHRWGDSSHDHLRSESRNNVNTPPDSPYTPRHRKIGYGLAAASMLPAIFVQVPSGLSVSGSLVSGIMSADQITRNASGITTVSSGTDGSNINNVALKVGFSVIQVAIGITVGLFLAALAVYPLGKKRSGLFSF